MDDHGLKGLDYIDIIVISRHPNITVEQSIQSVYEDQLVYFNGSGSDTPSDNMSLSYYWDFGDGTNSGWLDYSVGPNTNHMYTDQGVYNVTFIVRDNDALVRNASVEVTVINIPPVASTGNDLTVDEDETANFLGNGTDTPSDIGGLTYYWDFGNGIESETWSSNPEASTIYTDQGIYTAVLTVKDDNGDTSNSSIMVVVNNVEPLAKIKADKTVINEDESIQFDAGESQDTESDISDLEYTWQFEDEGSIEHSTNNTIISHMFKRSGDWDVRLTVKDDNEATNSIKFTVTVHNVAPTARISIDRETWNTNEVILFSTNGTWDTPTDLLELRYKWNFGDGSKSTEYVEETSINYTYTEPGEYEVILTVMDDFGAKDTDSVIVTIEGVAARSEEESEAELDYMWILIGIIILVILIILFFIFKRKIDKEHEDDFELEEESYVDGKDTSTPPPLMIPGLPPIQPLPKSAPTPQSDEELRFEAAVISQSTLEKVEALGKKGIDVSQPLGTLELVQAAINNKDYLEAYELAKLAQGEAQALPQTPPAPRSKVKPLPAEVPLSPKPEPKKPPQPKIKKIGILDKVLPSLRKQELERRDEEEAKRREMEAQEAELEEDYIMDEDTVLEYDLDPAMSDRITQLKSQFIKPIKEGMNSIEERLERAQVMLKRVQDLDQIREAEAEAAGEGEQPDEYEDDYEEEETEEYEDEEDEVSSETGSENIEE
jgi:PKD repeat protein